VCSVYFLLLVSYGSCVGLRSANTIFSALLACDTTAE
jgi:hypothetical protein